MASRSSAPMAWEPVPFRHVVLFAAAMIIAVVLVPVGVRAAGQLVSIVDSDSDTDQARVDAGKLRVGDGSGNLTVDGSVVAVPGAPTGQSAVSFPVSTGGTIIGGVFGPTTRYAISSLTFFGASTTSFVYLEAKDTVNGACSTFGTARAVRVIGAISPGQTMHLIYPENLMAPFGGSTPNTWCLFARSSAGSFTVFRVGRNA